MAGLVGLLLFTSLFGSYSGKISIAPLSGFMEAVQSNQIESAEVLNETVLFKTKDGSKFKSFFPEHYIGRILDKLTDNNVAYRFTAIDGQRSLLGRLFGLFLSLLSFAPMLIITAWLLWPMINSKRKNKNGEMIT